MPPRRSDTTLLELLRTIATNNRTASRIIEAEPELALQQIGVGARRQTAKDYFLHEIAHYVYEGDTALHIAAAAHQKKLVLELIAAGASVDTQNRRRQQPLHYAVDGGPGSAHWSPPAQVATLLALIEAGADPNAADMGGVTPLHRAVRNRCAGAVKALLERGADPRRKNGNGSTPAQLASRSTGRGGSGAPEARAQQAEILRLLAGIG